MNIFQRMGQGVTHWAYQLGHSTSDAFHNSVEATENAFNYIKSTVDDAINTGQTEIARAIAGKKAEEFSEIIESIRTLWPEIESDLGSQLVLLNEAASYRAVSYINPTLAQSSYQPHHQSEIVDVMTKFANLPGMHALLAQCYNLGMKSWGLEFAGDAGLILSGSFASGVYADILNPSECQTVAVFGVGIGITVGAGLGGVFVLNKSPAKQCTGSSFSVVVEAIYGGGAESEIEFDLPDFSFSGIAFAPKAGIEINISAGASYTIKS
ncbi:hypothetical protein [Phormidium tenue]|jgi:hypothetical protein|uniref:Uncharacterized protein n=1 Tax=Phormidium tenue FACHB-1050 TaxID=2692857 RepID=A0ABR8CB04_9CYAN|nr:hypothetical protein [Phormidium tenue]MBD2317943.1 hypothetical protein [Phormidium tenue FACHB-1050]